MSLWNRLRRLLGLQPPARRIAHLAGEEAGLDEVSEEIDLSGGPLKEMHRRRALRDRRLLPKKSTPRHRLTGRRKRFFPREEADRLFSATLRTRNRSIRDLLPDEDQLRRYGLPVWRTEADVAAALGITVGRLRHFSMHRDAEPCVHYFTFAIPKRGGGERLILAPKRRLKALQRALLPLLVDRLPVHDAAHGFRRGRSILTGAQPHVGRKVLVQFDLQDFFPTVTVQRVRGYLLALGYGYSVAQTLAVLMTESERQPVRLAAATGGTEAGEAPGRVVHVPVGPRHCVQGAPTSPGLCNAVCLRLDRRLSGLARRLGFTYTRYADDLTFSGDNLDQVATLRRAAEDIIRGECFRVNRAKTRIRHSGGRQTVTGVTVNQTAGLSRKERRRLRAALHQARMAGGLEALPAPERRRLEGRLAYAAMLNPRQAARLTPGT